MLVLSRRKDESIVIGKDIVIKVLETEEGRVKLGITAPADVSIHRHEVYEAIQRENLEAALKRDVSMGELESFIKDKNK